MAREITIGIADIEFAPVLPTGGAGTVFFKVGQTLAGSFNLNTDAGTPVVINVEEQVQPIYNRNTEGAKTMDFEVVNYDFTDITKLMGGTTLDTVWSAPEQALNGEFTIKITPNTGYVLQFNRVAVSAELGGNLGRDTQLSLMISGNVLQPTLKATPLYTLTKKA